MCCSTMVIQRAIHLEFGGVYRNLITFGNWNASSFSQSTSGVYHVLDYGHLKNLFNYHAFPTIKFMVPTVYQCQPAKIPSIVVEEVVISRNRNYV